ADHGDGVEQEHIASAVETRTRGCVCAPCGQNDAARPHQTRKEDQDRYYQGRCSLLLLERIPQIYPSLRAKRSNPASQADIMRPVVLMHNHPGGDPTPSRADIEMTRVIVEIAKQFGIAIQGHIIAGKQGHASLKGLKLI